MSQDSGWSKEGYGLRRQWLEDRYMSQDSGWSKEGYGLRTATCLKTVAGVRKAMVSGPLHVSRQWLE